MNEQMQNDEEFDDKLENIFDEEFDENDLQQTNSDKNLHKVKKNSLIAGVCTGLAAYFGIEPIIIRVMFIVSILLGWWSIALYVLAAILMPSEIRISGKSINDSSKANYISEVTGSIFILISLYFLADNILGMNNLFLLGLPKSLALPFVMIISGLFILIKIDDLKLSKSGIRKNNLVRSKTDKRLFGVCGGLADYLNVESNNLRIMWIIFSFLTIGVGVVLYFFITVFSQTENETQFEIQ